MARPPEGPLSAIDFQIAVICALETEADAVEATFDRFLEGEDVHFKRGFGDANAYTTGVIGKHNIVLAYMPGYGKSNSAAVAANLQSTFPYIQVTFIVGVCGGVPKKGEDHILLGDVIISTSILEYDRGKETPKFFQVLNPSGTGLSSQLQPYLNQRRRARGKHRLQVETVEYLAQPSQTPGQIKPTYLGFDRDKLFAPTHLHKHHGERQCGTCNKRSDAICKTSQTLKCESLGCHDLVLRDCEQLSKQRATETIKSDDPHIHFGQIGSADKVLKSSTERDRLATTYNLIGFEMEGAGAWEKVPSCCIIKGVCDYSDSHKNEEWQEYAAATAAACFKAFLSPWVPKASLRDAIPFSDRSSCQTLKFLQRLFVVDPPAVKNEIEAEKGGLLPDTGSWLFQPPSTQEKDEANSTFNKWWTDNESSVLWIRGDPGKGKTMLAISLINELERRLSEQAQCSHVKHTLAHFFCAYTDDGRNHTSYVVQSLLWQVLDQHPSLALAFCQKYEKQTTNHRHENKKPMRDHGEETDQQERNHIFSTSTSGLHSSLNALNSTLDDPDLHCYFVVDALDECSEESQAALLNYLKGQKAVKRRSKMKWLLTVRNDVELWNGALTVSLEENAGKVNTAVNRYINGKVQELASIKSYDEDLRDSVQKYLHETANGTFLWVSLVCRELNRPKVKTVNTMRVLRNLPPGLVPLYRRMLVQLLDNEDFPDLVTHAISIIQTVIVAFRPLTLTELAIAANLPESYRDKESWVQDCISLCGSFLSIRKATGQVTLIHQSAKDYLAPKHCPGSRKCRFTRMYCSQPTECRCLRNCLTRQDYPNMTEYPDDSLAESYFPIQEEIMHTRLTKICIEYLIAKVFPNSDPQRYDSWGGYSFPSYASSFWVMHGRAASPEAKAMFHRTMAGSSFLRQWLERIEWLERDECIAIGDCLPGPTILAIASYTGIPQLVEVVLENGADVNELGQIGPTGLYIAAYGGNEAVVELLISKGAVIDNNASGETPLEAAVQNGHESVARILIKAGAAINKGRLGVLLHRAVENMHGSIIRLLIENGAIVSAPDDKGRTPLHIAAAGRAPEIRASLNWDSGCGYKVPSLGIVREEGAKRSTGRADEQCQVGLLKLLIEKGAAISAVDNDGYTPLHMAVDGNSEIIVRLLIDANADINCTDKNGWTALQWALEKETDTIVHLLLDKGADLNIPDKYGRTVLHWATQNKEIAMVRCLLEKGAQPNILDTYSGATALHIAVHRRHKRLAELLLEKGAHPNAVDETPRTMKPDKTVPFLEILTTKHNDKTKGLTGAGAPLHWADMDMAALLLDNNADPNIQENVFGMTPLAKAEKEEKQDLVQLLVKRGADPKAVDKRDNSIPRR